MSEIIKPIEQRVAEAVQKQPDSLDWAGRIMEQIEQTNPRIRDGLRDRFEELFWKSLGVEVQVSPSLSKQGVIYAGPDNGSGPSNSQRHVAGLAQLPPLERRVYLKIKKSKKRRDSFNSAKDGRPKMVTVFQRT